MPGYTYLTDGQVAWIVQELEVYFSLPFTTDLGAVVWEQILARALGGEWVGIRDNRPRPDLVAGGLNYSVKTEGLRTTKTRRRARDFLGYQEDLIVARPPVDAILQPDQDIGSMDANLLGSKVLEYYNRHIVAAYKWDVLSILFRVCNREFIYFEQRPPTRYNPDEYSWVDTGRATGGNRNIGAHPKGQPLSERARFRFKYTSGGKQFYILYTIPRNADVFAINPGPLDPAAVRDAILALIREQRRG